MHVAALNEALAGHPARSRAAALLLGQLRGAAHPRHPDARDPAGALPARRSARCRIEFANPRHQHEYAALKKAKLPAEFILLPGVIDTTTNYVEHPEVVANRICEAVDAVGDRKRVIASSDCGFGTFAGYELVAEDVVWAKLKACREGADIATKRLWGR